MSILVTTLEPGHRLKLNDKRRVIFSPTPCELRDGGWKGENPAELKWVINDALVPEGANFLVHRADAISNTISGWFLWRAESGIYVGYAQGMRSNCFGKHGRSPLSRIIGEPKPGSDKTDSEQGLAADAKAMVGKSCPKCAKGTLTEKAGRYGSFVGCDGFPRRDFIWKRGAAKAEQQSEQQAEQQAEHSKPKVATAETLRATASQGQSQDDDTKALAEILGRIAAQKQAPLDEDAVRRIAADEAAKVAANGGRIAGIQINELPPIKLDGFTHSLLPEAVKWASAKRRNGLRFNVALVGDAGTGKSTLAEQVAKVLGLEYAYMNCSGGVTEAKLLGRMTPNITTGEDCYSATRLVQMYEHGGLYCADEMDGLDANVLLSLNGMIENGHWTRPDGSQIKRHADFVFFATMNTFGTGASRVFSGRNQLDGASLDRWKFLECDYDETLEANLCSVQGLAKRVHAARRKMREMNMRRWITGRAIERIEVAVQSLGQSVDAAIYDEFSSWSPNDRRTVGFPETRPA